MVLSIVVAILTCYLLGNLNGAFLTSAMLHDDVREHGSGNAGLTNFIRNYGAGKSVMVIFVDAGKAILACLTAGLLLKPYGLELEGRVLGGICVILGHDFPAALGFKGGKGILSGLFIALMTDWRIGLIILAVFAVTYLLTRYVSLSSTLAAAAFAVSFAALHFDNLFVMLGGVFMGLLTIFMHRGNISRLIHGQEPKTDLFGKGQKL